MVVIYRGTDVAIQSDSMAQQQGTRRERPLLFLSWMTAHRRVISRSDATLLCFPSFFFFRTLENVGEKGRVCYSCPAEGEDVRYPFSQRADY